jgi:hypothetical protein
MQSTISAKELEYYETSETSPRLLLLVADLVGRTALARLTADETLRTAIDDLGRDNRVRDGEKLRLVT